MKLPIPIEMLLHGKTVEWERLEFLKELDMTEGRSTGIPKILHAMDANGSPPPVFDFDEDHSFFMVRLPVHPHATMPEGLTPEATPQVGTKSALSRHQAEAHEAHVEAHEPMSDTEMVVLRSCATGAVSTPELLGALGYGSRTGNFKKALARLLQMGLVEMTSPDRPRSRKQKYRLTAKGLAVLKAEGQA